MHADKDTTSRSRELGAELRRIRERAGYNGKEIAHKLGWSVSRVSRLESGRRGVSEIDMITYLALCVVTSDELTRLLGISREVWAVDWLKPKDIHSLIRDEVAASQITQYEPDVIPGLVQTEDYARALFLLAELVPSSRIELMVRTRMERLNHLRREWDTQINFFIPEEVLRSPIGGPQVMNDQLLRLVLISSRPWYTIRVVPQSFSHGVLGGAFRLMEYDNQRPVVYAETLTHSVFLESPADIDMYRVALSRLEAVALDGRRSRELLATLANEYDVRDEGADEGA